MWRPGRDTKRDPSPFEIMDLEERHVGSYLVCLEGWSSEMHEAGDHKSRWYEQARNEGLRVKLAVNSADEPVGMIQYVPIEISPAEGHDLYVILCIWVHGYKQGIGDAQGRGMGTALLRAAEEDAKALGAKGMAAWGLHLPVWMRSSWFKKHGYVGVDRAGVRELVWKPFESSAQEPRWVPAKPVPAGAPDEVEVTAYISGWCPAANLVYERSRRAAEEIGTPVNFSSIDTSDRDTFVRCGHSDEVFIDGKPVQRGAPPSYKKIHSKIKRRVARIKRS